MSRARLALRTGERCVAAMPMMPSPIATSEPTPETGNPRLAIVKRCFSSSSGTRTKLWSYPKREEKSGERRCQQSVKVVAGGQLLRQRIQASQMIGKRLYSRHRKVAGHGPAVENLKD